MTIRILVLFLLVFSVYSCTKLKEEDIVFDAERQKFCDMDTVKFTDIQPIINTNCISCHNATDLAGGIALETHADISLYAIDGILITAINHNAGASAMPKDADKLHACYIKAIETWTAQGALNN